MFQDPSIEPDLAKSLERIEPIWRSLRGARIFVTGASGFFGSWLLKTSLYANDRLDLRITFRLLSRKPQTPIHDAVTWIQGDGANFDLPDGEWTHIIHAGTDASPTSHLSDLSKTFRSIVHGTERSLDLAERNPSCRFLLVSSGAVYGPIDPLVPNVSESYTGGPNSASSVSAYAEGKRASEMLCVTSGVHTSIARCFAFVGPYQPMRSSFAIGNFIADAVEGKKIVVAGDGTAIRSYLYASDLAEQLWSLLALGGKSEAYNVGSEIEIDIKTLAGEVNELVGGDGVEILGTPNPNRPVQRYVPSTKKIEDLLQLPPRISLHEAIVKTASWYRHFSADK